MDIHTRRSFRFHFHFHSARRASTPRTPRTARTCERPIAFDRSIDVRPIVRDSTASHSFTPTDERVVVQSIDVESVVVSLALDATNDGRRDATRRDMATTIAAREIEALTIASMASRDAVRVTNANA